MESTSVEKFFDEHASGKQVIIRTCNAGVWFGELYCKAKDEVILRQARRLWYWWAAESISLSAVAVHGVKREKSKIAEPVKWVWLQAIEILPCSEKAITSIGGCPRVEAQEADS